MGYRAQKGFAHLFIILGLPLLIIGLIGLTVINKSGTNNHSLHSNNSEKSAMTKAISTSDKFITANPLDLSQIKAISKFRSCAGHDFSGTSYEGAVESDRSMKHYIEPLDSLAGSIGKIKVFSPVTGTVDHYEPPHEGPGGVNGPLRGSGIWIKVLNLPVDAVLAHVDPILGIKEGTGLTSGQLVGYANLGGSPGNDFDLVIQGLNRAEAYYSVFEQMTSEILSQYQARGITADNIIISKEYRDSHPCLYPGKNQEGNAKNTNYALDFVELR